MANINHALRIPALSALSIPVQGGNGNLNPSSGSGAHGASWRMVVELGDPVTAAAIYPGGQSGNPASRRYTDRIPAWAAGELDSVLFPPTPDALPAHRIASRMILRAAR
jgi:penicillin amidase